jgi:hypothetical protein
MSVAKSTMTARERWLAAVDGKPVDHLPFWPKIGGAYARAQAAPWRDLPLSEMHRTLGSEEHAGVGLCSREVRRRTGRREEREGDLRRITFETPGGDLVEEARYDEATQSWHPTSHPVKTREDILRLTEWCADAAYEFDAPRKADAVAHMRNIGEGAVVAANLGTSPLMRWIEWLAGIENAHYLLADHPGEVADLFATLQRGLLRLIEIEMEHNPADLFYLTENTSTTLLSPEQYRTLGLPHIVEAGGLVRAAGRRLVLHMCGKLKHVLPLLAQTPATAFEAFTSPPVGDTRLIDGRTACPDVCLIGGTNATLWLRPADEIVAEIERDLQVLPHHRRIVVTSAGMMPPACRPETIREVCRRVHAYPVRM